MATRFEAYAVRGAPEQLTHIDFIGGKGFVEVVVPTASGPVTVIDTHLQAGYGRRPAASYQAQRVAQVVQLAARLWRDLDPSEEVLEIGG